MKPVSILYAVAWFIGLFAVATMIPDLVVSFLNLQDFRLGVRMMLATAVLIVGFAKLLSPLMEAEP